jgi:hypothetical protein
MPKIITSRRLEGESEKAREYVRTHIVLPSSVLGLIFMVAGMAALIYQFLYISYDWRTFAESAGLLLTGMVFGWAQTRYHHYLLREFPENFAGRFRLFARNRAKRPRKEMTIPPIEHPRRNLVPFGYALGTVVLFTAAAMSSTLGQTYYVAAFLLPWVGFFWAKVYFWRGVLVEVNKKK